MNNGLPSSWDVIVIGGGPAGSCVSTLLAKKGRRVLLLEKEKFPRHHIGESLIPETYWPLHKMGVIEKLRASGSTKKFSVQFFNPEGKASKPFYFFEVNHHESAVTWQVVRAEFDMLLLNHARECGVTAIEGAPVKDVIFEGDRAVGVEAKLEGKDAPNRFDAKVIVDATGLDAFLGSKLGLRVRDRRLRKAVVYSYWKNAMRDSGADGGATLVIRAKDGLGWFWFIPQRDDVTSIGIVADPDYLIKNRGKDYEKILMEEIAKSPTLSQRIENATRCDKVYTAGDYSYRSSRCSGPGWVTIGDAFGFLDPIYSTGVFLALKSGELASEAIDEAFAKNDFSAEQLGKWGPQINQGIETFRKLDYAYYTHGFSFAKFMRKYPQYRDNIIDILTGNVFRPGIDDLFEPMSEFFEVPPPLVEWEKGKTTGEAKPELQEAKN
jgi:flavin-dependent dehydrogenase